MPLTHNRVLILIGLEGPKLVDQMTNKLFWHPMATDGHWRALVVRAVSAFLSRAQDEWRWNASGAAVAVFRNPHELATALGSNKYDKS